MRRGPLVLSAGLPSAQVPPALKQGPVRALTHLGGRRTPEQDRGERRAGGGAAARRWALGGALEVWKRFLCKIKDVLRFSR